MEEELSKEKLNSDKPPYAPKKGLALHLFKKDENTKVCHGMRLVCLKKKKYQASQIDEKRTNTPFVWFDIESSRIGNYSHFNHHQKLYEDIICKNGLETRIMVEN